eukprot:TRINITY_DN1371_c0_g1_i1.p1 TRINITY_DN1371_c0_g1~~TRINITY_DN1371_c0_g1_i1.p1  ORF type:complete len:569 (+),score=110.55 TRINITY_DN1371_c0_g1_i1:56-1762(+)
MAAGMNWGAGFDAMNDFMASLDGDAGSKGKGGDNWQSRQPANQGNAGKGTGVIDLRGGSQQSTNQGQSGKGSGIIDLRAFAGNSSGGGGGQGDSGFGSGGWDAGAGSAWGKGCMGDGWGGSSAGMDGWGGNGCGMDGWGGKGFGMGGCGDGGWGGGGKGELLACMASMMAAKAGGKCGMKGDKGDMKGDAKGKGKGAAKIAMGEQVYSGPIKSYNAEKKHAYIVCEDIYSTYGDDVYAYETVLQEAGAGAGDVVAFFVHWSPKGQAQASSPIIRISARGGYALKGVYKPAAAKDAEKGHGFLECGETMAFFGRDVYVNRDLASTLTIGQSYAFNCYLNREGKPNVESAEACDASFEPPSPDYTQSIEIPELVEKSRALREKGKGMGKAGKGMGKGMDWGADKGKGMMEMMGMLGMMDGGEGGDLISMMMKAKGKGGCKAGKAMQGKNVAGSGKMPDLTGRVCQGTLKSFNHINNYGFLACEELQQEYGCDVFVHGAEAADLPLGIAVSFDLALNSKGKPQALNLRPVGSERPAKMQKTSGAFGGDSRSPAQDGFDQDFQALLDQAAKM